METGSKSRHCTRCDAKTDVTVIPVTEHSYITSVVKPICTENGYTSYLCENCGNSYKSNYTIAPGHTPGEWVVDKNSDCTHGGTKHQVCSVCGETIKTQTIPMAEHEYVDTVTKPTCTTDGFTTHTCSVCGDSYTDRVVKAKGHSEKSTVTKATMTKDGKVVTACTECGAVSKTSKIYKASTIKLSALSYTYDGKAKAPSVTVQDSKGKTLVRNTDYTVSYASGRTNPGRYAVTVTLKGNYAGTKTLYFDILPGVTSKVIATQTTNAIKLTWNAVSKATGYRVYLYNTKTKKYQSLATTTKNTYTITKLTAGTDYIFAVRAYSTVGGKVFWASGFKTISTATKPNTPTLKAIAGTRKVTLSWNKQVGADGYVVYMSTSKNGKYTKIATVKGNAKLSFTKTGLTKGKTYYFKVAAYSAVGGKNIFSSFSSVKYAKVK